MSTNLDNIMTATNLPNGNYLPIDLNLINNPQYKNLSIEAMMLHALYTMRMTCSIYNSQKEGTWLDENGVPYIYFSNEEAAALLRVSERKITNLKNALSGAGLIQVLRHGLKNYRIYVSNPKAPEKNVVVQLAFKNYTSAKTVLPVDKQETKPTSELSTVDRGADSATTNTQDLLTSTQKHLAKQSTSATNVTNNKDAANQQEQNLIAGLQARYAHVLPQQVFQRFLPFCEGDYQKARWFVDTIFKAKYASTQQYIKAGLPAEAEVLTFEANEYFKADIGDAIAKAIEQMYRYKTVKNPEGFFFAFMRGFFSEKIRQYLVDHYQLTPALKRTLSCVQLTLQQKNSRQKPLKAQKVAKKIS
ncbi:replication initiator protein A [Enterococcus dongliensis]|uniref:replication initiator protein A n=1 Tax=Enterococcus dongliensis TaxID=2559925 RepID=UPI002890AB3C|nr:replication initiator protein A [Enterococcus dongliensis]MDT2669645.1 replication initiator protein A [Enterococcus dongliensis]MDT2674991.1 replication initiator protein A [Enterococcus dongliensis]MDT2703583.1 replication initiator protein A [Enterococcus dongliensis]